MNNTTQPDDSPCSGKDDSADDDNCSFCTPTSDASAVNTSIEKHPRNLQPLASPAEATYDKFILFPKLPLELRLMVWRYTFPGSRLLSLDVPLSKPLYRARYLDVGDTLVKKFLKYEDKEKLPISLKITNESRRETLTKYFVVRRSELPCREHISHCLNLSRDQFYFTFTIMYAIGEHLHRWISHIDSSFPSCLRQIRSLNMFGFDWYTSTKDQIVKEQAYEDPKGTILGIILLFSGLTEILMTSDVEAYGGGHDRRQRQFADARIAIEQFLNKHKHAFESGMIPSVVIRDLPTSEIR